MPLDFEGNEYSLMQNETRQEKAARLLKLKEKMGEMETLLTIQARIELKIRENEMRVHRKGSEGRDAVNS